jgi:hypothetical protein
MFKAANGFDPEIGCLMSVPTPTHSNSSRFQLVPLENRVAPGWLLANLGLDTFASDSSTSTSLGESGPAELRTSVVTASRDTALSEVGAYDGPERRRKSRPRNFSTLLDDMLHSLERRLNASKGQSPRSGS